MRCTCVVHALNIGLKMNNLKIERVNYFTGEALLTSDFQCEQTYQMSMLALSNTSLNTFGIAAGLEVTDPSSLTNPDAKQVEIGPGVAIDGLGRQIVLSQAQVLAMNDAEAGSTYFITINYHEVFADLSDASGVPGYKRIVQQPQLRYLRNVDQPGIYILLAVVSFTTQGNINQLTYKFGRNQRRYVGAKLGSVNFVTEGTGVLNENVTTTANITNLTNDNHLENFASISAKREGNNNFYLEFDTPRAQFMGQLTSRGNLGIGNDSPDANLQIDAITFKGEGSISSNGLLVSFTAPPNPFLRKGDILMSDASLSGGPKQTREVLDVLSNGSQVKVSVAFNPALTEAPFTYIRGTLARFSLGKDDTLLQVLTNGSVGIGKQAAVNNGADAGPNALVISADRKVGIALTSNTQPRATLEVNGPIIATDLKASGKVTAQSFEGNGSKLQGMSIFSYWTKQNPNSQNSNLYYSSGNVGIFDADPLAPLSVGGGQAIIGNGIITSVDNYTVVGQYTNFTSQIQPGYQIAIGTMISQYGVLASTPTSDTVLMLESQFPVPVSGTSYQIQSSGSTTTTAGEGTISSNGTQIVGSGTSFTKLKKGDTLITPRFSATSTIQQGQVVASIKSATELTLAAAFKGNVVNQPYTFAATGAASTNGTGTVTAQITDLGDANPTATTIIGVGTNFGEDSGVQEGDTITVALSASTQLWEVASVESDTQLSLFKPADGTLPSLTAATSNYMIASGLLGKFKANYANAIQEQSVEEAQPAAMLVLNNNNEVVPNTVTINVQQDQVDRSQALQVVGPVKFSGGTVDFGNLVVDTLFAKQSAAVGQKNVAGALMTVGAIGGTTPQMLINPSQILLGKGSSSNPTSLLDIAGNLTASGNIGSAQQVSGAQLNASNSISAANLISATGGTVQGNALLGNSLGVTGLKISNSGIVNFFGTPISNTLNQGTPITAPTDGLLLIGSNIPANPSPSNDYAATITLTSTNPTTGKQVVISATGLSMHIDFSAKKADDVKYYLPMQACFTTPLQATDTWSVAITMNYGNVRDVTLYYYWFPLGSNTPPTFAAVPPAPAPAPAPAPSATPTLAAVNSARSSATASRLASRAHAELSSMAADAPMPVADVNAVTAMPNEIAPEVATALASALAPQASVPTQAPDGADPATLMNIALENMRQRLAEANAPATLQLNAQQAIDQRVNDLTDVFADATGMSADQSERAAFVRDLQQIVCSPGGVAQPVDAQKMQALIDTFGKASNHQFTPEQIGLLQAGIEALTAINANDTTRNDLNLIKKNIGLFLDNVQQVLNTTFSKNDVRLLTRALVRLVGDGSNASRMLPALAATTTTPASAEAAFASTDSADLAISASSATSATPPATPRAAPSLVDSFKQHVEGALGTALQDEVKPALGEMVSSVLQGAPLSTSSATVVQKIEEMLPNALDSAGKQVLTEKLNQVLGQHTANGFVGQVEQALNKSLADGDKQSLQSIVSDLISGKTSKEDAGSSIWAGIESAAKTVLEDKAKGLLGTAISGLLGAIF